MIVDISFNPKEQSAILKFEVEHFTEELKLKECLAIITIVGADFYLDPEIELDHLTEYLGIAKEQNKKTLIFDIHEGGVELELA